MLLFNSAVRCEQRRDSLAGSEAAFDGRYRRTFPHRPPTVCLVQTVSAKGRANCVPQRIGLPQKDAVFLWDKDTWFCSRRDWRNTLGAPAGELRRRR